MNRRNSAGARVGKPEVGSRGRPIGARDDDVTVVGSPTEGGGHEARWSSSWAAIAAARRPAGMTSQKPGSRVGTGSQPEHQPGSIRRKSQEPTRGGPPIERTSRVTDAAHHRAATLNHNVRVSPCFASSRRKNTDSRRARPRIAMRLQYQFGDCLQRAYAPEGILVPCARSGNRCCRRAAQSR